MKLAMRWTCHLIKTRRPLLALRLTRDEAFLLFRPCPGFKRRPAQRSEAESVAAHDERCGKSRGAAARSGANTGPDWERKTTRQNMFTPSLPALSSLSSGWLPAPPSSCLLSFPEDAGESERCQQFSPKPLRPKNRAPTHLGNARWETQESGPAHVCLFGRDGLDTRQTARPRQDCGRT
ncbi:hypothetical protein NDU88_006796 [Pleurodeles waltl]|uniref:Uncharacterized protein n=1 Tax=Pleurodeles waltl TaxID=8319 RepID=A0AAV7MD99_PLEWA|nr:hypothetical protein NDU88_006796 [Pleurodeles waltl]